MIEMAGVVTSNWILFVQVQIWLWLNSVLKVSWKQVDSSLSENQVPKSLTTNNVTIKSCEQGLVTIRNA